MQLSINTRNLSRMSSFTPSSAQPPSAGQPSTSFWRRPNRRWMAVGIAALFLVVVLNAWAPDSVGIKFSTDTLGSYWRAEQTHDPFESGPVVLAMVMVGESSAKEGQHMIKSILMRSSRDIDLHIIASDDAMEFLRPKFHLVTRPVRQLNVTFYPVTSDVVSSRAERAGVGSKHHAGVGGLVKMFLHEILSVKYAVYIDTDAFFAADPVVLWQALGDMVHSDPTKLLAFPNDGPAQPGETRMCSCVLAMNLDAMRSLPLMPSTLMPMWNTTAIGVETLWEEMEVKPHEPTFGDQSLYAAMWKKDGTKFGRVSRSWDISFCLYFHKVALDGVQDITAEEEKKLQTMKGDRDDAEEGYLFPGIVHFNCIKGEGSAFEDPTVLSAKQWGPMVATIAHYKWVWFNQRKAGLGPSLSVKVEPPVQFLDERLAQAGL